MKYTLNSQEYNEMFKKANEAFDNEMVKRDIIIENMGKKLKIMNYVNEFIENKINNIGSNSLTNYTEVVNFSVGINGTFGQYGYSVHPKFKKDPIDIFNLKLSSGNTIFKNSLIAKVNDVEDSTYINFLKSDNSIEKEIIFNELTDEDIEYDENSNKARFKLEYSLNLDNPSALGSSRFNMIEIDPYIYGGYSLDHIEIFSLSETNGIVSEIPIKTLSSINNIGKLRVILDEKVKFSKVVFHFDLINVKTQNSVGNVYPFGLKHIYFYEADFLENSTVIIPIRASDYFEYIYNDIVLYHAGEPIYTTCDFYNIEIYSDFLNNTLTGRIYTSSDAAAYRIAKNTKTLYAKVPLIWTNEASKDKQYLSLLGIGFNYTLDENTFI